MSLGTRLIHTVFIDFFLTIAAEHCSAQKLSLVLVLTAKRWICALSECLQTKAHFTALSYSTSTWLKSAIIISFSWFININSAIGYRSISLQSHNYCIRLCSPSPTTCQSCNSFHRLVTSTKGADLLIYHSTHWPETLQHNQLYEIQFVMITVHLNTWLLKFSLFLPSGQTIREVLLVYSERVLGCVSVKWHRSLES